MGGEVLVALLVTGVLGDVVEVLATDDDGAVHLGGDDGAGQDTATDGNLAGEGALLVDVLALNGSSGGAETQTNVLVPSAAALARSGGLDLGLGVEEDMRLLLKSTLALDGKLGSHLVGSGVGRRCAFVEVEERLRGLKLLESEPKAGRFLHDSERSNWNFAGYVEDDHVPFLRRGVEDILHIIPTPFPRVWHTMDDDVKNLDVATVKDWAKIVAGFVGEWMDLEGHFEGVVPGTEDEKGRYFVKDEL